MEFLKSLSKYYVLGTMLTLAITAYMLSRSINNLATSLSGGNNQTKTEEPKNSEPQTATLVEKADLVYAEGILDTANILPLSNYKYSPDLPEELYKGYMVLLVDYSGGKYFVWIQNKQSFVINDMAGYFPPISKNYQIGNSDQHAQLLIPVIRKDMSKDITAP